MSGGVRAARRRWLVGSLLLASTLLTACHQGGATGTADAGAASEARTVTANSGATGSVGFRSSTGAQSSSDTPQPVEESADVTWEAPTTNTNGSALTDLAGFRVYYGTSPSSLTQTADVPSAGATDYVVQGLTAGTWYFAVAAYTNTGVQSSFSSVVSKTIS